MQIGPVVDDVAATAGNRIVFVFEIRHARSGIRMFKRDQVGVVRIFFVSG